MKKSIEHLIMTGIAITISAIYSAYMVYLRVPSVIETRPSLADVSLTTGLFSDKATIYLFYNYQALMIVMITIAIIIVCNLMVLGHR